MTETWVRFLTTYTQVDVSDFFALPAGPIMEELLSPAIQELMAQPRSAQERKAIQGVHVGFELGKERPDQGYVGARNWRGVALFNSDGRSDHLIVQGITAGTGSDYRRQIERCRTHVWTDAAKHTPRTVQWLKERVIPHFSLAYVRIMVLGPEGIIPPHQDIPPEFRSQDPSQLSAYRMLNSFHASLQEPKGHFYFHDQRLLSYRPGAVKWLNNSREHWAVNMGSEDRYHLIFHGVPKASYRDYILENQTRLDVFPVRASA